MHKIVHIVITTMAKRVKEKRVSGSGSISELERRSRGSALELLQVRPGDSPRSEIQGVSEKSQSSLGLPSEQIEIQSLEFS